MPSLNHSIHRYVIGRDLDPADSLTIKKSKHFSLKLSTTINYYSLKDPISINDVFLDKRCNRLCFLVCNSPSFRLATYIILGHYQVFLSFSYWHISDVNCLLLYQTIRSYMVYDLFFSPYSSELAFLTGLNVVHDVLVVTMSKIPL